MRGSSRVRSALALVAALALPSCETRKDPVGPGQVWTVIYAVELTGSGAVTRIAYDNGQGGTVTVANPTAGWSTTLLLPPGSTVALRAQAGLAEGRFRLLVDARSPSFPPIVREKDCSGTTTACDLEIPKEMLP